jgi:hypothetical protein
LKVRDPGSYAITVVAITLVYQWPFVYLIGTRRGASNLAILVCLGLCLAYHLRHSRSRRQFHHPEQPSAGRDGRNGVGYSWFLL